MSKIKTTAKGLVWAYAVWMLLMLGYKITVGLKESQAKLEEAAKPYIPESDAEALTAILGGLGWEVAENGDWVAPDGTHYPIEDAEIKVTAMTVSPEMMDQIESMAKRNISGVYKAPQGFDIEKIVKAGGIEMPKGSPFASGGAVESVTTRKLVSESTIEAVRELRERQKADYKAGLVGEFGQELTHRNCDNGLCMVSEDGSTDDCPEHNGIDHTP